MSLADLSAIAQIIAAIAVVASLAFVGVQVRQNTMQLRRGAADSAMAQASAIRLALLTNREVAELLSSELKGEAAIDAADEMRLNAFFSEITYMAVNAWHRERILGVSDTLPRAVAPVLRPFISSPHGLDWWRRSRKQFEPAFIAALEATIPAIAVEPPAVPQPGQQASTAIAPEAKTTPIAPRADAR